jgi:hypothetical protein
MTSGRDRCSILREGSLGLVDLALFMCGARTRDQRINGPPFAVVANKSRNYLHSKLLRCSMATDGCR